jgi:uncharacterized protein YciI
MTPIRHLARLSPSLLALLAALLPGPAGAEGKLVFERWQLVLLKKGPAWSPEVTLEVERIQREHLAHLGRMAESGKMMVAGPFERSDDPDLRGLCVYRVGTAEEARALASEDPAVKAGRLAVSVVTWMAEKGALAFPLARP